MKPYPVAINDCYDALVYLKNSSDIYGYNKNQLMVGGELFYSESCAYIEKLIEAGVYAKIDIYHSNMHEIIFLQRINGCINEMPISVQ